MKKNDRYFKIAKLISEELSGSLSAEDKVFLENWLNESGENRDIYHQIKNDTWFAAQSERVKKYHPAEGWEAISKKIKSPSKGRSVFLTISKYAATAAILVSAVFFIKEITFDKGAETEIIQPKVSAKRTSGASFLLDFFNTLMQSFFATTYKKFLADFILSNSSFFSQNLISASWATSLLCCGSFRYFSANRHRTG